jgi:hypothetical protein
MLLKPLLTTQEVLTHSQVLPNFTNCSLTSLFNIEFAEFKNCFGKRFYEDMQLDLVDYSSAAEYVSLQNYAAGDVVKYAGTCYIATIPTTAIPTTITDWELAKKFTKDCYNELWCHFLAEYLSLVVVKVRLPFLLLNLKPEGLVRFHGNSYENEQGKDKESDEKRLSRALDGAILLLLNNIEEYVKDKKKNDTDNCYANWKAEECEETTCGDVPTCGCGCGSHDKCLRKKIKSNYVFG